MSWKLRFNFHHFQFSWQNRTQQKIPAGYQGINFPPPHFWLHKNLNEKNIKKKFNFEIFSFIFQLILIKFCMRKSVTIRRMWLMIENTATFAWFCDRRRGHLYFIGDFNFHCHFGFFKIVIFVQIRLVLKKSDLHVAWTIKDSNLSTYLNTSTPGYKGLKFKGIK